MKRCVVVVEGPSDVLLLEELLRLRPGDPQIRVIAAGGWSAADSLARSFLVRNDVDVALVVDADAIDESQVAERRRFLDESLGMIASQGRHKVFVIAPELEAVFFSYPEVLEALVGRPVSAEDLIRGRFEPKKVLLELLQGRSREAVFKAQLLSINLDPLRAHPVIHELEDFVRQSQVEAVAA